MLSKVIARIQKAVEKLLDAYQENLLQLDELRQQRMPELESREKKLRMCRAARPGGCGR
ncbi:MAG: hypothetical protein MZV70_68825 [Desulfobacterales bacterium]|nr:hypothetical protein [Desulfobacterales bacterium]